eukprot:TRINITY_DN7632_c0_g1_i1.p1 TRINITY_DN7632_c0_g1~~TRINITY_DN7632_c0_g1_i1.p1  ORF type:complete len:962 (+),score=241.67 TRINITY_DN7632_c0_g1_i1:91-2886(+)
MFAVISGSSTGNQPSPSLSTGTGAAGRRGRRASAVGAPELSRKASAISSGWGAQNEDPGGSPRAGDRQRQQAATRLQATWRGRRARVEYAKRREEHRRRRASQQRQQQQPHTEVVASVTQPSDLGGSYNPETHNSPLGRHRSFISQLSSGQLSAASGLTPTTSLLLGRGVASRGGTAHDLASEAQRTPPADDHDQLTRGAYSLPSAPSQRIGACTQLTDKHLSIIREAFTRLDSDNSGTLGAAELLILFRQLYPWKSEVAVGEMLDSILADSEDTVSLDELIDWLDPGFIPGGQRLDAEELEMMQLVREQGLALDPPDTIRAWLWALLNVEEAQRFLTEGDWLSSAATYVQVLSQVWIAVSVVNMMIESEPSMTLERRREGYSSVTFIVEAVTIAFFSVEFFLRVFSAPDLRAFWRDPFTWVDVLAIAPFFLTELGFSEGKAKGLAALRIMRLTRLLRIIKVGRHSVGIYLLAMSVRQAMLPLVWLIFVILLFIILAGSVMWNVETAFSATLINKTRAGIEGKDVGWYRDAGEHVYEDDRGQKIAMENMMEGMWWAAATLTATGYGEPFVPYTKLGKAWGALVICMSIVFLAFPATILTQRFCAVFSEYEQRRQVEDRAAQTRRRLLATHFKRDGGGARERFVDAIKSVGDFFSGIASRVTSPPLAASQSPQASTSRLSISDGRRGSGTNESYHSRLDELRMKQRRRSTALQGGDLAMLSPSSSGRSPRASASTQEHSMQLPSALILTESGPSTGPSTLSSAAVLSPGMATPDESQTRGGAGAGTRSSVDAATVLPMPAEAAAAGAAQERGHQERAAGVAFVERAPAAPGVLSPDSPLYHRGSSIGSLPAYPPPAAAGALPPPRSRTVTNLTPTAKGAAGSLVAELHSLLSCIQFDHEQMQRERQLVRKVAESLNEAVLELERDLVARGLV